MTTGATSLMTGTLSPVDSAIDSGESEVAPMEAPVVGVDTPKDEPKEEPTEEQKEEPADAPKAKINFLEDDIREMTYSRRFALKLMKYPWYYPRPEEEEAEEGDKKDESPRVVDDFEKDIAFEKPSLEKGWAFFEHQALYRYLLPEDYKEKEQHSLFTKIYRSLFMHGNKTFEKADPGDDDDPSRLYPVNTPHSQLGDFGLGVGLYFSSLRALIFISLLCGIISLGNILYFASDKYDPNGGLETISFETLAISGSAACSSQQWVPCPTCNCTVRDRSNAALTMRLDRCAIGIDDATGIQHTFALKNECDGTHLMLAGSNFATVCVMVICILLLGMYMKKEEVRFDEDEQTAQDYSIQIKNPPPDAKEPDEWREFFRNNFDAEVIVCTCAVENDLLVKCLVERREAIRTILSLQPGESMELLDIAKKAASIERDRNMFGRLMATVVPGIPEYYTRLVALKGKVEGLAQLEYPVTNVFVTFETEQDQRRVLKNLSVGYRNAKSNNKNALSHSKFLFRGEMVLDVVEPEEPSTIFWQNLNAPLKKRLKQQIYTLLYTLVSLVLVFVIIYYINLKYPVWATYS